MPLLFFPHLSSSKLLSVLNSFEFRNRCLIEFDVEIETSCVFYWNFRFKLFFESDYDFFLLWCLHPVLLFLMMASRKELWAPPCRPSLFFPIFLTVTYLYNFKEKLFLVIILYFSISDFKIPYSELWKRGCEWVKVLQAPQGKILACASKLLSTGDSMGERKLTYDVKANSNFFLETTWQFFTWP